jgi:hypothetical protein
VSRLLTTLAAILGAACVAAIWSLLSLNGVSQWWLAPLAAFAIVLFLHSQGVLAGLFRALVACLLFVCSAAYAAYIEASGSIGAELGLTLVEGLRRIGPEMALAWLRAHRGSGELAAYALGLLLSALLGAWLGRRTRGAALIVAPRKLPKRLKTKTKSAPRE